MRCDTRGCPTIVLIIGICLLVQAPLPARAGTISGTVRDALTGAPLSGIDVDVLDDQFRLDPLVAALTGADGTYTLAGVNGDVYVRADPTLTQGYVDRFWPGSFLPSQAQLIAVGSNDVVTGIDLALETGTTISGLVLTSDLSAPLAGCDIDVIAPDGSFLSGVDAATATDGSYVIGLLPPGEYLVKADPTVVQGYVPVYHPNSFTFGRGVPVAVGSSGPIVNVNFVLQPGGEIAGRILETGTLLPVVGVDLDMFDVLLQPLADFDASTDELGLYSLGIVPVGTYYVLADPLPDQPWVDTFYGQSATIQLATPVSVSKGQSIANVDIQLQRQGFLAGTVLDAVTAAPIEGIDLDVLDPAGTLLPQYDGVSGADGSFRIGPIPAGSYLLRADAAGPDPWADQYHPGSFALAGAVPIVVADDLVAGLDFSLVRGGWIRGTVRSAATGQPLAAVDLDVMLPDGSPIPSVDADTDASGLYRIGAVPPGSYLLRADPDPLTGLAVNYWPGADQVTGATTIQVLVGLDTAPIDFSLVEAPATATPIASGQGIEVLTPPHPNPFTALTSVRLRAGKGAVARAEIFDLRGRRVRRLSVPATRAGQEFLLQWNGRDDRGRSLSSGVYFLRLGDDPDAQVLELLRVR